MSNIFTKSRKSYQFNQLLEFIAKFPIQPHDEDIFKYLQYILAEYHAIKHFIKPEEDQTVLSAVNQLHFIHDEYKKKADAGKKLREFFPSKEILDDCDDDEFSGKRSICTSKAIRIRDLREFDNS